MKLEKRYFLQFYRSRVNLTVRTFSGYQPENQGKRIGGMKIESLACTVCRVVTKSFEQFHLQRVIP